MEPVEVQARWDSRGHADPARFTWQGQEWQVESTGRCWKDEAGEHILCMTTGGKVFELIYHPLQERWFLGFHNAAHNIA